MSIDMTDATRTILATALHEICNLSQPYGHDCDDDNVIETISELLEEERDK